MEDIPRVGERALVSVHRADRESEERLAAAYRCLAARRPQSDSEQSRPKRTSRSLSREEVLT